MMESVMKKCRLLIFCRQFCDISQNQLSANLIKLPAVFS
jgi:hypothetical protein